MIFSKAVSSFIIFTNSSSVSSCPKTVSSTSVIATNSAMSLSCNLSSNTSSFVPRYAPPMVSYLSILLRKDRNMYCTMTKVALATCASKSLLWHLPSPRCCLASLKNTSIVQRIWYASTVSVKVDARSELRMVFHFPCLPLRVKYSTTRWPFHSTTVLM